MLPLFYIEVTLAFRRWPVIVMVRNDLRGSARKDSGRLEWPRGWID